MRRRMLAVSSVVSYKTTSSPFGTLIRGIFDLATDEPVLDGVVQPLL
ncbi:hypothetical protein [Enterococcus sp. AZ007]